MGTTTVVSDGVIFLICSLVISIVLHHTAFAVTVAIFHYASLSPFTMSIPHIAAVEYRIFLLQECAFHGRGSNRNPLSYAL